MPARVALISDMHGNAVAFDAVLRELDDERFDEIVSLGDVSQGGPQPAECIDLVREHCEVVLGGNHDLAVTGDPRVNRDEVPGLFNGGPGATGRSHSDFPTILQSIRDRLLTLPPTTRVLPGHGAETMIKAEASSYDDWVRRGH